MHSPPASDIAIAQAAKLLRVTDLARYRLRIADEHLVPFGHYKEEISLDCLAGLQNAPVRPDGKLILVIAISPTPAGEGKTTTMGLGYALNHPSKQVIVALRTPSLGPSATAIPR